MAHIRVEMIGSDVHTMDKHLVDDYKEFGVVGQLDGEGEYGIPVAVYYGSRHQITSLLENRYGYSPEKQAFIFDGIED